MKRLQMNLSPALNWMPEPFVSALRFSARCCYCWSAVCTCSLISFIFVSGLLSSETWFLLTTQTQGPFESIAEPKSLRLQSGSHIIKWIRKGMRNILDMRNICTISRSLISTFVTFIYSQSDVFAFMLFGSS